MAKENIISTYRNRKPSGVRLIQRNKSQKQQKQEEREVSLHYGSVWGIHDRSVPFDRERKEDDFKDALRTSIVLETPEEFSTHSLVWTAPGTSKKHDIGKNAPPCLKALPEKDNVKQITYFLIYMNWYASQKTLDKRFCEISTEAKEFLSVLIDRLRNE